MVDFSAEARQLIDAGGWEDDESEERVYLRRRFGGIIGGTVGGESQVVFEPDDEPAGVYRLSQMRGRILPTTMDFTTLEEALRKADFWRQMEGNEDDAHRRALEARYG